MRASELELGGHDLVCLAVPARALPGVLAAHGERIPRRAGVLVALQGPRAAARHAAVARSPPSAAAPARSPCSAVRRTPPRCSSTAPRWCSPRSIAASPASSPTRSRAAELDVSITTDVTGVELAGVRQERRRAGRRRRLARPGPTSPAPPPARCSPRSTRSRGPAAAGPRRSPGWPAPATWSRPWSPASSRNRRAGELLAQGVPAAEIGAALGHAAEAVDSVPLLATAARDAQLESPALDGLAALVEGRIEPEQWTATVTEPARPQAPRPVRAA